MNTKRTQEEALVDEILSILSQANIKNKIEVLGNVFLRIGVEYTDFEVGDLTKNNIYEQILRDMQKNGDTLGNSLIRQGLVILDWLNEGK